MSQKRTKTVTFRDDMAGNLYGMMRWLVPSCSTITVTATGVTIRYSGVWDRRWESDLTDMCNRIRGSKHIRDVTAVIETPEIILNTRLK